MFNPRTSTPPAWLARLWQWGGVTAAVMTVGLAAMAWIVVDTGLETADRSMAVTGEGLTAMRETLEVVDGTLLVVIESSERLGGSIEEMGTTVEEVAAVVDETSDLLTIGLPADIGAIRTALDGLVDTANVVDGVLGALSFVGVPYNPEVPMDEALVEVDQRIADLAPRLRAQGERLAAVAVGVEEFGLTTAGLGEDLQALRGHIEDSRGLLGGYQESIDRALDSVVTGQSDLRGARFWARAMIVAGALLAMLVSSAVWWLGRSHLPVDESSFRTGEWGT